MLSVKETASKLGISASKVYSLVASREIVFYRIGGKILFSPEDVDTYLAGCRVGVQQNAPTLAPVRLKLKHVSL